MLDLHDANRRRALLAVVRPIPLAQIHAVAGVGRAALACHGEVCRRMPLNGFQSPEGVLYAARMFCCCRRRRANRCSTSWLSSLLWAVPTEIGARQTAKRQILTPVRIEKHIMRHLPEMVSAVPLGVWMNEPGSTLSLFFMLLAAPSPTIVGVPTLVCSCGFRLSETTTSTWG